MSSIVNETFINTTKNVKLSYEQHLKVCDPFQHDDSLSFMIFTQYYTCTVISNQNFLNPVILGLWYLEYFNRVYMS